MCDGVIPYLLTKDCEKHSKWISEVFGAKETSRYPSQSGKYIMHMALSLNDGEIYMADEECAGEEYNVKNTQKPDESKGVRRGMHCYVQAADVDVTWKKAVDAGAVEHVKLEDKFWGERFGIFKDPWGYFWSVSTPIKKPVEQTEHLKIVKAHKDAVVPEKPKNGKVGYALHAAVDTTLGANEFGEVDTGLSIVLPKNTFGRIAPPSQLQTDLEVQNMMLDGSQQRLRLQIRNLSNQEKKIQKGEEIAQLIIEKSMLPEVTVEE